MAKYFLSILAASAAAVIADPLDVTPRTLNGEGGTGPADGLFFGLGWNQILVGGADEAELFYGDNQRSPSATFADMGAAGASMAMHIGSSAGGTMVKWEYVSATFASEMSWTSAEVIGEDAQSGALSHILHATYNSLDYAIQQHYTYTFPNKYIQVQWEFTIPEGHESGYDVIAYFLSDTVDTLTVKHGYADDNSGAIGITYDGSSTAYAIPDLFMGFQYICGDVIPKYNVGLGWDSGTQNTDRPGYALQEEFVNTVGTELDTGIQMSFNLGSAPGTYTVQLALVLGDLPNLECSLGPDGPTLLPRPYAQVVSLWIGFAFFVTAALYLLLRIAFLRSSAFAALPIFLLLSTAITALAYLIMVLSETSFALYCNGRQFEWLRYAAWAAVAPLTIAALGNLAHARPTSIMFAAGTAFLAVAGLFAGAVSPNCIAAWPLLAFSIVAGAVVVKELFGDFSKSAAQFSGGRFASLYAFACYFQVALWVGYAVVWGVSEGGKVTTATQEIITFTVLDILSKAVFGILVYMGRNAVVTHGSVSAWLGGAELSISISSTSA